MLFSVAYNNKLDGKGNWIAQNQDFKKYLLFFYVKKQKFAVVSVPSSVPGIPPKPSVFGRRRRRIFL